MAESGEHRDTENNWVIPNTEGLTLETVGFENGESLPSHEEVKPAGPEPTAVPEKEETGVQEVKGPESPPLQEPESPPPVTEIPSYQEPFEIPPEEPQRLGEEPSPGLRRRLGADLEEVSCSSSDDDMEGLRKRAARGTPPTSVGPTLRESIQQQEEDSGFSLTVNKCIIAAVALVALAVLVFTGGLGGDEDLPQTVITRSVRGGDNQPETIANIQEWLHQHADQFTGDPDSLQVMNDLLDKVAKENQEIRHIQAKLQAQKEELETLLHGEDKDTQESQQFRLTNENERLKEALLREETGHLFAKEEVQTLQEKLETMEANNADKEGLTSENTQLEADLEESRSQIEGFLTQKETLVAESQMLRQELDKQRSLVVSIRQDLDSMTSNTTEGGDEKGLQSRIMEMNSRLAMEAQRSETWEKTYVEHAQKRKELVGEEKKSYGRKEWKKGDKWSKGSDSATAREQFRKPHFKHGKEHGKRWTEDGQPESQHEEWKAKKHEDKQQWREKKHRHWEEEEKTGTEDRERHPRESEGWKDKDKDNGLKDPSHQPDGERNWKDKHSRHHHGEAGNGFHPRKGQKEFSEAHKHGDDRKREHGDKAHGKEHRHHDHNKFWKKLSDHQYRVPEGCSGLEDCARKDGIDLFNVDLQPVQRKRFEEILQNYLTKSDLSKHLPELVPLLDGFFEGPYFSHHKIRFKDFVDDVEDFLEDLAKKETGSDDLVDDFERFVYTSFFGDAAIKKRSKKKDGHRKSYKSDRQHNPKKLEETSESELNQTNPNYTNKKDFKVDADNHNFKPYKGKYKTGEKHRSPNHHSDEDGNGHGWKKHKKYDGDGKYHQESHQETSGHYFNETRDSVHEQGEWHYKKPKYNTKDHNHGYRSYHEDYHDRKEDGKHFQEQKPYKKDEEHKDGQGHHYHKNKFDTEDREHPRGKDRHEHKHKNSPSFVDHNEDTEQPFHHEHKPYGKKQEKDAINEYYRSPDGHHHGNKPWKEGGDQRHEHKPWKQGEGDRHEHKPWKQGEGDRHEYKPWKQGEGDRHEYKPWKQGEGDRHEHKPWKQGEGDRHEHKPWKQGEGDRHEHKPGKQGEGDCHEHKPLKQGEGGRHEHKPWKQGEGDRHENKPWKQGEGDRHEHKPWKQGEGDRHEHKPLKQGEGGRHEHKPWKQGEGDRHENKPWKQGEGDCHEHKPWKQGEGDRHEHTPWKEGDHGHGKPKHYEGNFDRSNKVYPSKPSYDKHDDHKQKPYHGKGDDHKQKPYHGKEDDHKQKPYHGKEDDHKQKPYHGKEDDHKQKPYHGKEDDHKQKPYHGKEDDHKQKPYHGKIDDHKPHHGKEDDHKQKPYHGKEDDHKRKPYHGKDDDHKQKPYDGKEDDHKQKPYHGKVDDHKQKPYHGKEDDHKQKPYHGKEDDHKQKPYHGKEDDHKRKPYHGKDDDHKQKPYNGKEDDHKQKPSKDKFDDNKH